MGSNCERCMKLESATRRLAGIVGSACHLGPDGKVRAVVIAESLRESALRQAADAIGNKGK